MWGLAAGRFMCPVGEFTSRIFRVLGSQFKGSFVEQGASSWRYSDQALPSFVDSGSGAKAHWLPRLAFDPFALIAV